MCREKHRCDDCDITLSSKILYERHLNSVNHLKNKAKEKREKAYQCESCDISFISEIFYEKHLLTNRHFSKLLQIDKNKEKETYHCNDCDITLTSINYYNVHLKSSNHKKNLIKIKKNKELAAKKLSERLEREQLFKKSGKYYLELKNKQGIVVGTTKCDKAVYFYVILHNYTVNLSVQGYVHITVIINGKSKMHRFNRWIYYEFYKNKKTPLYYVDHKNGKKLDNRIKNLREFSKVNNSNNRLKQANTSSKYYGVSRCHHQWQCQLRYKKINISFVYDKEPHAAYHYNLMVKEHNLQDIKKLNKIKKPIDFVMTVKKDKKNGYPKGVLKIGSTFSYKITHQYKTDTVSGFLTPESAGLAYEEQIKKIKNEKQKLLLSAPIKRNIRGDAIIELFNKKREKVGEQIVDDQEYYKLILYSWHRTSQYSAANINGKTWLMSRFLMNCDDEEMMVDHADGNPSHNKKSNLRIVTVAQNNQNKKLSKNASSIYTGVNYCKTYKRWKTTIMLNYECLYRKTFKTELEAAKAREIKVIEFNKELGTYYKLNF